MVRRIPAGHTACHRPGKLDCLGDNRIDMDEPIFPSFRHHFGALAHVDPMAINRWHTRRMAGSGALGTRIIHPTPFRNA